MNERERNTRLPFKFHNERGKETMSEERTIQYTEWKPCDTNYLYCINCRKDTGLLMRRMVTGRDGDTVKEYRIECTDCGQKSGVHMSKNLTIFDWEGHQEPKDTLRHRRRVNNNDN